MSDQIDEVLSGTRRIAVLGIKTEDQGDAPAFYVPRYLVDRGFDVVPVPVYYPEVTTILGRPVQRTLSAVDPRADMVLVFRRAKDLPAHLEDILDAKPRTVWLQLGIKNEAFAARLRQDGIQVVQDRCLMVEHRARTA